MVQGVSMNTTAAKPADKKPKAKKNDNGTPGIITQGPFDPDFGPSLNPRFDGQYSWDLTNFDYLNYLFGLVNMMGQTFYNGFGTTPGATDNTDGRGATGPGGSRRGNTGGDNTGGFPPLFGSPGVGFPQPDGNNFLGQPGTGSPFPMPPPYDPDLGPSLNPTFDGQYGWNLTNFDYLNGLLNGVNVFGQVINGFPVAGQSASAPAPAKKPKKKPKAKN